MEALSISFLTCLVFCISLICEPALLETTVPVSLGSPSPPFSIPSSSSIWCYYYSLSLFLLSSKRIINVIERSLTIDYLDGIVLSIYGSVDIPKHLDKDLKCIESQTVFLMCSNDGLVLTSLEFPLSYF
jgi:hypothetical protein